MFFLSRQHRMGLDLDAGYRSVASPYLILSFPYNTQQKVKVKQMLYLELITLQRGYFRYELSTAKRKSTYISKGAMCTLRGSNFDYFCYSVAKFYISMIKDLSSYSTTPGVLESDAFDVLQRNNFYVKGLRWRTTTSTPATFLFHQ